MVIRAIITYGLSRARGVYSTIIRSHPSVLARYTFFIACLRSRKLPLTGTLSARAEPSGGIGPRRPSNWENHLHSSHYIDGLLKHSLESTKYQTPSR